MRGASFTIPVLRWEIEDWGSSGEVKDRRPSRGSLELASPKRRNNRPKTS